MMETNGVTKLMYYYTFLEKRISKIFSKLVLILEKQIGTLKVHNYLIEAFTVWQSWIYVKERRLFQCIFWRLLLFLKQWVQNTKLIKRDTVEEIADS